MNPLNLGDPLVPFTLPGVDGRDHALESNAERAGVVVIFSCNHCPYVQAWEDRMRQIHSDFAPKGVRFFVINANDAEKYPADSFEQMKARAREKGFAFPYLRDEDQAVAKAYGAQRTPEVYAFDAGGKLRYHGAIDDNYEDPGAIQQHYLRQALEAVLAGQEPSPSQTDAVGCTIKWK